MKLSIIVAVDNNGVIGYKNDIPWRLPSDLKFFREKTGCSPMIMGRKTFESLPKVLPGRRHLVVTSDKDRTHTDPLVSFHTSFKEALRVAETLPNPQEEIFVIGGASMYKEALPFVDQIYMTAISSEFDGDVFFPEFHGWLFDTETIAVPTTEDDGLVWFRILFTRRQYFSS